MPIVGGLDIHRKQITFDYLDTVTGQVQRGQISPADREHLRAWLARFRGLEDVAFAVEGCTGWRYVVEELAAAGITAHLAERPIPRSPVVASGTPRPIRPTAGTCGCCWPRDGCRSAGSRPPASWSAGRCWRPTMTCGPSTPPGRSGSTRCCSTRVPRPWARACCAPNRAWPRCGRPRPSCLSPAGQLQVATALDMTGALETRLHELRHQLLDAARHLTGAKVLAARLYGVGPVTALAMTCWLAGKDRFSSSRQVVRFAGLDVTVSSSDRKGPPGRLSRQGPPVLRWAVYEAGKTHARSSAPDYACYAQVKDRCNGKRAALSEARKILRQACHILAELGDDALAAA